MRRHRPPSYRLQKSRNLAVVTIDGNDVYLGRYGSPESHERYSQLIAQWHAENHRALPLATGPRVPVRLLVKHLILRYWRFAEGHYLRDGQPTDELAAIRAALRPLRKLYGHTPVAEFGPKSLKLVQQAMIASGWSRKYCNDALGRIKRMFKWGVSEELIPVEVHQALATVPGLRRGRSAARDTEPIRPVSETTVELTLPHLPPVVADMVRLQRLTGCRPDEICQLRPCDVDRSNDAAWEYRPASHKTSHLGKTRCIFVGPKGQNILRPYLLRNNTDYCFSPADSERQRNAGRRATRRSPLTPSQAKRRPKKDRKRPPLARYTTASYRRAIHRACDKAFPPPDDLHEAQNIAWRKAHRWSPNQLRHAAATAIRKRYGLEAVHTLLGNTLEVAEVYAERDFDLARRIAKEVG